MKLVLFGFLLCVAAHAQGTLGLNVYLDNSGGQGPVSQLQSFPSAYTFAATPVGSVTTVGLRVVNSTASAIEIGAIGFVSGSDQNFSFSSDLGIDITLAPGSGQFFHINFVPLATGATSATAEIGVVGANSVYSFSVLQGTGSATLIGLSCNNSAVALCDGSTLQPSVQTAIDFGNVAIGSSETAAFTLENGGTTAIDPQQLVSIVTATNNPSTGFSLGTLPASIPGGSSGTFNVTFAPGTTAPQQATLMVAGNSFTLQGTGTGSLTITYTSSTGINLAAQPASPINFGTTVAGTGATASLLFTVTNASTALGSVSVPSISVSGVGFAITGTNPAPVSIPPGGSTTFTVTFSGSTTGAYTGTLLVGSNSFSLTAQSIVSTLPTASIAVDQNPLLSQQQPHVTVNLGSATPTAEIGTLTMQFTPSVANVSDDPTVEFVATSGRQLQVTAATGATTASYNGQSAITFQTGTTAGTIQFTVQFPNQAPVTQSFTITPATVQITSGTASWQSPNLVVTLNGFDNTYSAGPLSFVFYSTTGQVLTPTAISYDATSSFHQQCFFDPANTTGGAFSLQASFPVLTGDGSQVGSVAVTLKNSAGQTSTTQVF